VQTSPKEFQFHEFYWNVGTEPDPEDLKDDPEMPELVEDEDSDSDSEDGGDSDDEDALPPQDFLEELYKDFPSLRMESQSSSSHRPSKTQPACAAHPSVTTQAEELSNHRAEVSIRDSETTEPSCIPTFETTAQPGKEREAPTEIIYARTEWDPSSLGSKSLQRASGGSHEYYGRVGKERDHLK
jgi:hypothetical protein